MQRGYFKDSFVHHFVSWRSEAERIRSLPPVINRGYYARHVILKSLVLQFLREYTTAVQVVVLGCGFDTLYFQLKEAGLLGSHVTTYVECDFPDVIQRKKNILDSNAITKHSMDDVYRMVGVDLRKVDLVMDTLINTVGIDKNLPTLFLAECVLVYMETAYSNEILRNISFPESMVVVYEQVNPHDAFGKQMMLNLQARGCPLRGIMDSLEAHKERMLSCGWQHVSSETMLTLFNTCIPREEVERINCIEMLDEEEEWNLLLRHYCITWARNSCTHTLPSMSSIAALVI